MNRCPFALQLLGPAWKTSGSLNATGVTLHSAEYDLPDDQRVLYNALFSEREASWHFTITKPPFAFIFQHYEDVITWHCGPGNPYTTGIELEGVAPARVEGAQYDLLVKLLEWIKEERGWQYFFLPASSNRDPALRGGLYEHRQWMPTNCAVFSNEQVDPVKLIADLKEEEMKPLYQILGRPEVYAPSPGGLQFEHIPDQRTFARLGYKSEDVQVVTPDDAGIWDDLTSLPVTFFGIPAELR